MPHALQSILSEVGLAIAPLRAINTPEKAAVFFRQLGYEIPPSALGKALPALATQAGELVAAVSLLAEASGEEGVAEALVNVVSRVRATIDAIVELQAQLQAEGGAEIPNIGDFPRRLTDFLVLDYFDHQKSDLHETLHLLGLIEHEPNPLPEQSTRLINWDRFGLFLTEPLQIANEVYRWETDFDVDRFLTRMEKMMRAFSLPGGIYPQPATAQVALGNAAANLPELRFPILQKGLTPETYSQFGITFSPAEAQGGKKKGIALLPYLEGATEFDFAVCDRGELIFESTADLRGVGIVIRPPFNAEGLLSLTSEFHASVKVREKPTRAEEIILLGSRGGSRLSIQGLGIKWFAQGRPKELDLGFEAEAQALRLVIAPGEGDGFLQKILSGLNVQAEAGFAFGMTLLSGFTFKGGAKLALELGTHVDLGPVKVDGLRLSLAPANDHVVLEAGAVLRVNLGPLTAVVENVGLRSEIRFRPGNLGPADLDITFKAPTGLGLVIDSPVVLGGGYLFFDAQKEEYGGILQLEIAETIAVKAIGLLTTRMPDGGKGFSLVVIIAAQGFPPIQLGFGFTLIGIGGLLGVNRTVMVDVLRSGLKNGTLGSILFPDDPVRNAPQIVSDLRAVFPPVRDRYVFGPMAIIGWGTPAILTLEIGLILELPEPVRLIILGRLQAVLPDEDHALVQVRMDAIGVIDFNQGEVSLDATLYDSRILAFVLTGDMALRANWGAEPNFVLAIGGFNPRFPAPAGFPQLARLALSLGDSDNPRLRFESYLALTSNTVQFGARLDFSYSAAGLTLAGFLGFDALFQFAPFEFIADVGAMVALKRGSKVLMGVFLDMTLAGPTPWHVWGKATFKVLFFKVSIRFDHRFGHEEPPALPEPIDVLTLLADALSDRRNWSSALPRGEHSIVSLRDSATTPATLGVHPLAELTVRQRVVPLNRPVTKFGNAPLAAGTTSFTVAASGIDNTSTMVRDSFALAQYQEMSDEEKLTRPPFETQDAGLQFGVEKAAYQYEALPDMAIAYETLIIDPTRPAEPATVTAPYVLPQTVLDAVVSLGAAGQAAIRRSGSSRYRVLERAA